MTRRVLVTCLVALTASLAGACADPLSARYDSEADCQDALPAQELHCEERDHEGEVWWEARFWWSGEALCEEATGVSCQAGMCETECGRYQGGSGWLPQSLPED